MCPLELDLEEDVPTAKTCPECKGSGEFRIETKNTYRLNKCKWCGGGGRVPVSGELPVTRG